MDTEEIEEREGAARLHLGPASRGMGTPDEFIVEALEGAVLLCESKWLEKIVGELARTN